MADAPGRIKRGPLSGKSVGLLAGPEFSDFQAYYLNLYLSELGARVTNLVIGWPEVGWKMTRPATSDTVQGTFGLRLDPIPTMAPGDRYSSRVFRSQAELTPAAAEELDALIVLGGHSADVLRVDPAVTGFVSAAWNDGVLVGALECGQMVLMSAGVDLPRQVFALCRRCNDAQLVAQPLDCGAGHEDRSFQRIRGAINRCRHRREQSGFRRRCLLAGVREQEAACAIGILGMPRLPAGLSEERGLLVTGDTRDWNSGAKQCRIGVAQHT